jgi:hypothetical protein
VIRKKASMALLLLVLVAGQTPGQAPAADSPAPFAPSASDRLYLGRLGEAMVLSRAVAGKIWPGWGLDKTPILLYEAGRVAYLTNHPAPPPDFVRLEGKLPLLGAVYVRTGRDPRFTANTSIDLGGIPTACIGYSTAPTETESPSLRFIALVFHEAFHAFQAKAGKPAKGAVEAMLLRYPDLNAENLALAQLEQMILYQLVRFEDAPDPERIRGFLAVRQARAKALGPEFIRADRGIEYQEGIPTFLEVRLLEEAKKSAASTPGLGVEDPYALGFTSSPELRSGDYVGRLLKFSSDAGTTRTRAYGTGMALALVLDRLGLDWKPAALTSDKYLDEILADAVPLAPTAAATVLASMKKDYRYEEMLRLVQEKTSRLAQDRKAAADAFLRQQGIQVTLRFPDGPVELRAFDPMNIQRIDASRAIHRRMLRLASGESWFSASNLPIMVSLGEGPFDIRGVTFFLSREGIEAESDFTPLDLTPGSHEFRSSFKLSADGVSLQAIAGSVSVSADGTRIDIVLKR